MKFTLFLGGLYLFFSCNSQTSNTINDMDTDRVISYLEEEYKASFEVLDVHHLANIGNMNLDAPYEIKLINTIRPERPFYVTADLNDFKILEDNYHKTLISEFLERQISLNDVLSPLVHKLSMKLSRSNLETASSIKTIEQAGNYFNSLNDDSWYFYLSIVDAEYDEEKASIKVDQIIKNIGKQNINKFVFEVNFYNDSDASLSEEDIFYNPYGNSGERYSNEEKIQFRWMGQFTSKSIEAASAKGENLCKRMRKIKNFKYKG